ncbi:MAG TPA: amidohydrolase family protein [Myxococcota bacterium]
MHDHHLHLFAAAAALASARCGPPDVRDAAGLATALAAQPLDARGWVRGVGYHESVSGLLDRAALDRLRDDVPVRVQHRSGQLWMLNSRAVEALGLDAGGADAPGVERDARGRATGRLFRVDAWLRARLGPAPPPSLAPLGRRLAALGVTAVTDATPSNGPAELAAFAAAQRRGELPPRVVVMGALALSDVEPPPGIAIGPVKIHLADAALPAPDVLAAQVRAAHARGRAVAFHCTTRAELVLALAAFETAGVREGDRLEHVHVAPPECIEAIARLGLAVCVQPGLVRARRAEWAREVEPCDRPWLAPIAALRAAGVPLLVGSDAPYGPLLGEAGAPACAGRAPRPAEV